MVLVLKLNVRELTLATCSAKRLCHSALHLDGNKRVLCPCKLYDELAVSALRGPVPRPAEITASGLLFVTKVAIVSCNQYNTTKFGVLRQPHRGGSAAAVTNDDSVLVRTKRVTYERNPYTLECTQRLGHAVQHSFKPARFTFRFKSSVEVGPAQLS